MLSTTTARARLRVHILGALGAVAGCAEVPTPGPHSTKDGLYDAIDKDGDGFTVEEDCNDSDPAIKPSATEVCNERDDNCDGVVDEGVRSVFYRDADSDGFGNADVTIEACELPLGYVHSSDDCDDLHAEANPEGTELCDGLDNDCNGLSDDIDGFWPDGDGDGYGNAAGEPASACRPAPDGYVDNTDDCDDGNAAVNPGAEELCMDGVDNDCDGYRSCMVAELTDADGSACSVTWKYEDAETTDWSSPCEGCYFSFQADLVVAEISGASGACDVAADRWGYFDVANTRFAHTDPEFVPGGWAADGSWDTFLLTWYSEVYGVGMGDAYMSAQYHGELYVSDVEYYYGYYGYYYEGRPLTVSGESRTAEARVCGAWTTPATVSVALTPDERARVVAAWTKGALAEHAAVASFNRFAMELMSLGAPPELLTDTLQGAQDEVVHARDCFTVASAVGGVVVSPGPLPVGGALDDLSVEGILTRLLQEGCVDETVSTAQAARRLAGAQDPLVVSVLERIVADETRHAALAWRSARWILSQHPELRPLARAVLEAAMTPEPAVASAASPAGLRAYGVLSRSERADERARTLREVVAPAAAALLADNDVVVGEDSVPVSVFGVAARA